MVILQQSTIQELAALLSADEPHKINGFDIPEGEEIAPRFLLELAIGQLSQDPMNSFWWSPRLIVVDGQIVGMGGFKSLPTLDGMVEIGYGVVPSQQGRGFATEAVKLLLEEAFLRPETQIVIAYTDPLNRASQRVLEKNEFSRKGSRVDPEDGEVWMWQRTRTIKEDASVR